jgi:RecA/RadA recombinase
MAKPRASKKGQAEKAEDGSAVVENSLSPVLAQLQAKYAGKLFLGDQYTSPFQVLRYPTGLIEMDIGLQGGIPAGGMTMIIGKSNIGKNALSQRIMGICQSRLGEKFVGACMVTELETDKSQARFNGLQIAYSDSEIEAEKKLYQELQAHWSHEIEAELRRHTGTVMLGRRDTAEIVFDMTLDMIRSRQFNIVSFDSFGSLLTAADAEKDSLEDRDGMAGAANLSTRFMNRLNEAYAPDAKGNPNLTALIGLNQLRSNTNRTQPNSPEFKEAGANSLQHGRYVTIQLTRTGNIKKDSSPNILGKDIKWEIVKQKAGGPDGAIGSYKYMMASGFDVGMEHLLAGVRYGLVERSGNNYSIGGELLGKSVEAAARVVGRSIIGPNDVDYATYLYAECLRVAQKKNYLHT